MEGVSDTEPAAVETISGRRFMLDYSWREVSNFNRGWRCGRTIAACQNDGLYQADAPARGAARSFEFWGMISRELLVTDRFALGDFLHGITDFRGIAVEDDLLEFRHRFRHPFWDAMIGH